MSAFAALMALSASQTKEAQSAVQTALEQRNRNEELRRKKQEEEERKRRAEEAKLRQKRFEDERRQRELDAKRATEEARRSAEASRREEEARQVLLYGPKKAKQNGPRWPTSSAVERRRAEDEDEGPSMLTREEKRQRRVEAEMRRTYQLKRAASGGYSKAGRRLPGGAIDVTSAPSSDAGASTQSVKARLAAQPNTLTRLNVNKRDTRTIDEIVQDMAKAKNAVLDGDDAREFNDWFGKGKRKDVVPRAESESSEAHSPEPTKGPPKSQSLPATKTVSNPSGGKPSTRPTLSAKSSSTTVSRLSSAAPGKSARSKSPVPKSQSQSQSHSQSQSQQSVRSATKKRPRSASLSDSPPPKRRASECDNGLGSEIWRLFGKDRSSYVARDVLSDDEDMEADAGDVLKEELRSARLAKREDEMAFEEEKRHEEEKRRRKREREMRERQGM